MKRKIILVLLLAYISVPSHAQFWKKFGNTLKEVAVGVLYGAVDNMVQNSGDQTTINNWNSVKDDIAPSYSYGSEAGDQLGHGDTKGAIISIVSAGAEAAGVNADIVALGNAGLNNWVNGDNTAAIVDIGQMVSHASGNYQFDYFFDTHREYNQINRELKENLQSGMPKEEAYRIRNEKLANVIVDATEYIQNIAAERKAMVMARRREVKNALLQRGYSNMEADYLSTCLSIEDLNDDYTSYASADEMLDNHHIGYRDSQDENEFFDDINIETPIQNGGEANPPDVENGPNPEPISEPPLPVDPSADAKARLKEIAPDRYLLNHVGLNKTQKETLDEVASLLKQYPNIRICLNGNTCDLGSEYINNLIATKRANHAKEYLVKQGVDASRINIESNASSNPVADGQTGDDRLKNRRVSITVLDD